MGTFCLFGAIALVQLFYGPLSDRFGRKIPLLSGLTLYGLGGFLGAYAPSIETLIAARVIQGVGWRLHHLHHPRHHQRFLRKAGSGRSFCFNQWNHGRGPDFQFHFRRFVG